MPSPTDAFSGMVTKKGRFGTDPYDIFLNHGTSVNSRSKFTSHSRVMFTTHDRVDGYHQKAQIYNLAFLIASFLREIWR